MRKVYEVIEELFKEEEVTLEEHEEEEEELETDIRINLYLLLKGISTERILTRSECDSIVRTKFKDLIDHLASLRKRLYELEQLLTVEESADKETSMGEYIALRKEFFNKLFSVASVLQDSILNIIHYELFIKPRMTELERIFGQKTAERLAKILKAHNYNVDSIPIWRLMDLLAVKKEKAEKIRQLLTKYVDLFKLYYL